MDSSQQQNIYQHISKKIAVNLITGALGAGKTTLISNLLKQKPTAEKWILLVNEFGAVGIDGAILSQDKTVQVEQIPGGCICCSAQSELKETIQALLQDQTFDRLLIEPTGLGEPDTLVDLLQSELFAERFDIQSVLAVFDSTAITLADFEQYTIFQNLAHMADVIVFNKQDIAQQNQIEPLLKYAENLYPPKQHIIVAKQGKIDIQLLKQVHYQANAEIKNKGIFNKTSHHNQTPKVTDSRSSRSQQRTKLLELPYTPVELPNLQQRIYQSDLNTQSIGWIFDAQQLFDWTKIQALFQSLNQLNIDSIAKPLEATHTHLPKSSTIKRAKGVFRVGKPWMLFQWVNQQSSREYIAYRRDSRLELLISADQTFDFRAFETQLLKCTQHSSS